MCSCVVRRSKMQTRLQFHILLIHVMIHSFWKEVLLSMHANVNVPTITEGWVEKKKLALFVHYYECTFTSDINPSALLWVGTLSPKYFDSPCDLRNHIWSFPVSLYKRRLLLTVRSCICHDNRVHPLSTVNTQTEEITQLSKPTDVGDKPYSSAPHLAYLHCQLIQGHVCLLFYQWCRCAWGLKVKENQWLSQT